jgi:hypothetical protein
MAKLKPSAAKVSEYPALFRSFAPVLVNLFRIDFWSAVSIPTSAQMGMGKNKTSLLSDFRTIFHHPR